MDYNNPKYIRLYDYYACILLSIYILCKQQTRMHNKFFANFRRG